MTPSTGPQPTMNDQLSNTEIRLPACAATEHTLTNSRTNEDYLIRISRPMNWSRATLLRKNIMPVMYILDGGALFLSASETCWRRETSPFFRGGGLVVAIGHKNDIQATGSLYDRRRTLDFLPHTPRADCRKEESENPTENASHFLDFVEQEVRTLVRQQNPGISIGKEAIFGHSFGGLCVLHALFTQKIMFDAFIACSPSIWWENGCILGEEQRFYAESLLENQKRRKPTLIIMYGSLEETPVAMTWESQQQFRNRKAKADERKVGDNVRNMCYRLQKSGVLRNVTVTEFAGEDHGTVALCALVRGLTSFFEE